MLAYIKPMTSNTRDERYGVDLFAVRESKKPSTGLKRTREHAMTIAGIYFPFDALEV